MGSSTIIPAITTLLLAGYIFLVYFLIQYFFPITNSPEYPSYKDCAPSICGNSIIQYPFGICGLLSYNCIGNLTLYLSGFSSFYGVVVGDIKQSSYSTRTLQIAPDQITPSIYSSPYDFSRQYDWLSTGGFFNVSKGYIIGTIVNCTQQEDLLQVIKFDNNFTQQQAVDCIETSSHCIFLPTIINFRSCDKCTCYTLIIPGNDKYNITADKNFEQLQQRGFEITWSIPKDCQSCLATGGRCYSYSYSYYNNYYDMCISDGPIYAEGNLPASFMAVFFFTQCAAFSIVVVSCILFHRRCCCKRTASGEEQTVLEFMDPLDSTTPSVENFLQYYSSQVPTRYSYAQIRDYTNNLAEQLGKGGFGTVYKGKLPSGRMIAVKILDESKQSEQQFIAEVATVGSTYHVNLVRMLGYCSEGSRRALVYEYMVNGSLEKYIHGNHQDQLDWKQLYSIAVGTARGISYLHQDCRNRIVHCDIKPHNVLLDANYFPKVADFGLAKISKKEESHISAAQQLMEEH